ncbi:TerD family protein [Sinomonas flava]|uniref:TerD family protein n=1 Tax=Sinomonas flava TaxID=496857 RepID=A0ABN3BSV5_9MICC
MGLTLRKGDALTLTKKDGSSLTRIHMGLGWDAAEQKRGFLASLLSGGKPQEIDLDASAILYTSDRRVQDIVYYGQLKSRDFSITHTGDNLTGEGDGDDEVLLVDLNRVDDSVKHIVFVITSYSRQTFDQIENAFCRVVDDALPSKPEVARFDLTEQGRFTAMIMASLSRNGQGWKFTAIGKPANGKVAHDIAAEAATVL